MEKNHEIIAIGRFGRSFGVDGWIKVLSQLVSERDFANFSQIFARAKKLDPWHPLSVINSKQHGTDLLIKIANYDTKENVSLLANHTIGIIRTELPKLAEGTYYWSELIGLTVVNTKREKLGTVQQLMATGANDILVLTGERRRLIPYISQVIVKIDHREKIIYVDWEADYL